MYQSANEEKIGAILLFAVLIFIAAFVIGSLSEYRDHNDCRRINYLTEYCQNLDPY